MLLTATQGSTKMLPQIPGGSSMKLVVLCAALVVCSWAQDIPRVYVSDSQSWEMSGGAGGSGGAFGGAARGGARPQTAEVIKTLAQKCPQVKSNNIREKADYVVLFDHEGGKGWARKDNKIAVFNKDGDSIVSKSTMSLGGAVEDACTAILADWAKNSSRYHAAESTPKPLAVASPMPEMKGSKLAVSSDPSGADIEVNGAFIGNTPSNVELSAGEYTVVVKKNGYKLWERKIKITSGSITLAAELEKP
jgi:hypothetical protein